MRRSDRESGLFVAWFAFCLLIVLGVLGVFVWGFVKLVLWLTNGGLS